MSISIREKVLKDNKEKRYKQEITNNDCNNDNYCIYDNYNNQ